MRNYEYLKTATNEQLTRWHQECADDVAEMEKVIIENRAHVAAYQQEIDRRALVAYFEAHPELERVATDDKLLVTDEPVHSDYLSDPIGSINTVKELVIYRGELGAMVHLDASWGEVFKPFWMICPMRRAYLAAQETK